MEIKISNKNLFWFGVGLALFFILSFFIPIPVDGGNNYYITDTLLGILIGHSALGLSIYILIIAIIIAKSIDFVAEK